MTGGSTRRTRSSLCSLRKGDVPANASGAMLRQYGEELIHPVGAAMARADGFEAAGREFDWEVAVVSDRIEMARHLLPIPRKEEVGRAKQPFAVVPWSGDERDAARQGLEDADRRDARQRLHIGSTRHVDRHAVCREQARNLRIADPAAIGERRGFEGPEGMVGVAHATDRPCQAQTRRGADQELGEFRFALAIAPVADPDEVRPLLDLRQGPEQAGIRRLVPGVDLLAPAAPEIKLPQ